MAVAAGVDETTPTCACLEGNPFMHVMSNLTEGEEQPVPWKKRSVVVTSQ